MRLDATADFAEKIAEDAEKMLRLWIKKRILKKIEQFKNSLYVPVRAVSTKEYQDHKPQALQLAHERVQHFNEIYGFSFNRISIRNQKTRWGSCSSKKNINLNYKILFLPKAMQDYIIVHELCHLKEMNHSHRFWNLVQQALPDCLETRKMLRSYRL